MGAKKRPFYRIVVSDSRKRPTGRCVDELGHYDPNPNPALVTIDKERLEKWLARGARPSATVKSLIDKT
jgi:small subunit ribosomal protein S16